MSQGKVGIRIRRPIAIAVMKLNAMALASKWLFVKVGNIHERTATAPSMSGRRFVQKGKIIAHNTALRIAAH